VRLKRFLAKAKRGEGFTVGVVGGSGMSLYSTSSTSSTTHLSVGHLSAREHHQLPTPTSRWGDTTPHLMEGTLYNPPNGGSLTTVSAGHGLHYNNMGKWSERETPLNMNRAIFDHLDSLFPAPDGKVIGEAGGNGKNGFVNGAQGGTGESSSLSLVPFSIRTRS